MIQDNEPTRPSPASTSSSTSPSTRASGSLSASVATTASPTAVDDEEGHPLVVHTCDLEDRSEPTMATDYVDDMYAYFRASEVGSRRVVRSSGVRTRRPP